MSRAVFTLLFIVGFVCLGRGAGADPIARDSWRPERPMRGAEDIDRMKDRLDLLGQQQAPGLDAEQLAELLLDKAELLYEIAHYDDLVARDDWRACQARALRWGRDPERLCEAPKPNFSESLGVYLQFLTSFPDHDRVDQGVFRLGECLMRMGHPNRGANFLEHLLRRHPDSRFMADAHLLMAEFWFERGKLLRAQLSYESVITHMGSPLLDYAMYKLAWVCHLLEDHRRAVRIFEEVIALQGSEPGRGAVLDLLHKELAQIRFVTGL